MAEAKMSQVSRLNMKRNGFNEDGNIKFKIFHSCFERLQVILTRVLNRDTQPLPHSFHIHILSATGEHVSFY